jgi:hypothetical protein
MSPLLRFTLFLLGCIGMSQTVAAAPFPALVDGDWLAMNQGGPIG